MTKPFDWETDELMVTVGDISVHLHPDSLLIAGVFKRFHRKGPLPNDVIEALALEVHRLRQVLSTCDRFWKA